LERFLKRSIELLDRYKPVFRRMVIPSAFYTCCVNPNMVINWWLNPNLKAFSCETGNVS
jgi:hypothetical protein